MEREQKLQELTDMVGEGMVGSFVPLDIGQIIREAKGEFEN